MKTNTTEIEDLIGKEITKVFFYNEQLIIVTPENFAVFHGYEDSVSEYLETINLSYLAGYNYDMDLFVDGEIITREEIDIFKQKKKEQDEITEKDRMKRDLAERDRLNKLYPPD